MNGIDKNLMKDALQNIEKISENSFEEEK